MVASVVQAEDSGSYQDASGIPMLPVSQGQSAVSPQTGPTDCCAHQCQTQHLSSRDVLDNKDRYFLCFHIRKGTQRNYGGGWCHFSEFCNKRMIEPVVAPAVTIVKFIVHMFKANLKYQTMNVAVSAISKHHVWLPSGKTIAHHPVVQQAKKAFWQQRPPLPKYCCTFDASRVLKYLADLGENETLGLKSLTYKTAFLMAFSTLSRY